MTTHSPMAPTSPSRLSKAALFALILGILSIIPLGPIAAIPGIILGIVGMVITSRSQGTLRGWGLALAGLITSIASLAVWGVILLLIAILLPSLTRARELATRSADMANLRGLSVACQIYSADYGDTMPPDLQAASTYYGSPKLLKSGFSTTPKITSLPTNPADFEAHCDWVYIGADLTSSHISASPNIILLYSKPAATKNGRAIAFTDGRVEWVKDTDLPRYFDASNRARNAARLPSIYLDAPPPTAPAPRSIRSPGS